MMGYFRVFLRPAATLTVPGVNFGGDSGSCGLARRRCVKGGQEPYSQEQSANRSVQGRRFSNRHFPCCLKRAERMGITFTHHEPLDLAAIPEEVVQFGQRVVDITGPLAVCYIFVDVSFVLAISLIADDIMREFVPWRPTKMVRRFLFAGYGYVSLLLVIFHFSLGDVGISFFIALYEIIQPFLNAVTFGTTLLFGGGMVIGLGSGVVGIVRRDRAMVVEAAKAVGGMSLGALFPAFMITMTILNRVAVVPDLAVTITERDQLASLIAGILTLGYTIYTAISHSREAQASAEETDLGETQGLIIEEATVSTSRQLEEDVEQALPNVTEEAGTPR